jgi:hypothetical protein
MKACCAGVDRPVRNEGVQDTVVAQVRNVGRATKNEEESPLRKSE